MRIPPIGLSHRSSVLIVEALTVPRLPADYAAMADMPPVFATAYMIAFIEAACIEALAPYLEEGEATVGTHVDVSHSAATPIGMTASCAVELVEVDGRKLKFKVLCTDEKGPIGEGFHERYLIDLERFLAKLPAAKP